MPLKTFVNITFIILLFPIQPFSFHPFPFTLALSPFFHLLLSLRRRPHQPSSRSSPILRHHRSSIPWAAATANALSVWSKPILSLSLYLPCLGNTLTLSYITSLLVCYNSVRIICFDQKHNPELNQKQQKNSAISVKRNGGSVAPFTLVYHSQIHLFNLSFQTQTQTQLHLPTCLLLRLRLRRSHRSLFKRIRP
jgi:hypothetical protein